MAKKIEILGSFLIVTDTVSGLIESPQPIPAKEMTWNESDLQDGRVVFETTRFLSDSTEYELYKPFSLAIAVDGSGTPFTESTFRTFCADNLGKSSGGSASIPTSDIFHGGFVDYSDLATKTTPIAFTAVGQTVLLNDGLGANTFEGELPVGITGILDKSTGRFDFSELKVGDMVDFRMQLNSVTTNSQNQNISVDLHLGIGGFEYVIPFISDFQYKTAGSRPVNRFNGIYLKDNNTLLNPAEFRISSDGNGSVEIGGWYCKIIRKG